MFFVCFIKRRKTVKLRDKKNINNLQIKFKIVEVFQKILNLEKEDKISINN